MFNISALPLPALPINLLEQLPLNVRANLIKVMPKVLRPSLRIVPFKGQKALLLPALKSIFNEALSDGDFEFLQDKWLKISITDLELNWWLSYTNNTLIMVSEQEILRQNALAEVSFSATSDDLLLIAGRKQDPDTLFFQRRLKIEGDTELGLEVKNLIDAIDIEQLPNSIHTMVELAANFIQKTQDDIAQQQ